MKPPPWSKDNRAMLRWLDHELTVKLGRHEQGIKALNEWRRMTPLQQAMVRLNAGDAEPLRRYYIAAGDPEAARLVPELKKPKKKRRGPPEIIAKWAKIIREIWNEHYGNRQRRNPDWTAVEFAYMLFMAEFETFRRQDVPYDEWLNQADELIKRGKIV
jgi:hypothetical protein